MWVLILLVSGFAFGCDSDRAPALRLSIGVSVESDVGIAIPGARVSIDGDEIGATDSSGHASVIREVVPGQLLTFTHVCPRGFTPDRHSRLLRIRTLERGQVFERGGSDGVVSLTLRCRPERRLAVFLIRTRGLADVAVFIDGERVATTDRAGVAHVSRRASAGSDFLVELQTPHPRFRPRRVSRVFALSDSDEIFVFDQPYRLRAARRDVSETKPRIVRIE